MKRFYLILSLVAMLFISCEGDFGEGGNTDFGNITLDENATELLNQTLEGDALSGAGITFTANAAWSATVREVRSGASWLTISPDHGEAGTYTLSITLEANDTGADRAAEIIISCDGSTLKITITQKAAEQVTPSLPVIEEKNRIGAIIFDTYYTDSAYPNGAEESSIAKVNFTYNDKGEVCQIERDIELDGELRSRTTYPITYSGNQATTSSLGQYIQYITDPQPHNLLLKIEKEPGSVQFNSDGSLASFTFGVDSPIKFEYGADGRLVKYGDEDDGDDFSFTWSDGNIVSGCMDGEAFTMDYTDIDNVWGGVDWLFPLLHMSLGEKSMIMASLNKNGGLHTKKLPKSLYFGDYREDFTYTFDEEGQLETVTFWEETITLVIGGNTPKREWPAHVVKQEIVDFHNVYGAPEEWESNVCYYHKYCTVRTYMSSTVRNEDYIDMTFIQTVSAYSQTSAAFSSIGNYQYIDPIFKDLSIYNNATYKGFSLDTENGCIYYDFTTFSARGEFNISHSSNQTGNPWMYELNGGGRIWLDWPNEEAELSISVQDVNKFDGNTVGATDENGDYGTGYIKHMSFSVYASFKPELYNAKIIEPCVSMVYFVKE